MPVVTNHRSHVIFRTSRVQFRRAASWVSRCDATRPMCYHGVAWLSRLYTVNDCAIRLPYDLLAISQLLAYGCRLHRGAVHLPQRLAHRLLCKSPPLSQLQSCCHAVTRVDRL